MVICKPILHHKSNNKDPVFKLLNSVHPCVKKTGVNFVPVLIIFF